MDVIINGLRRYIWCCIDLQWRHISVSNSADSKFCSTAVIWSWKQRKHQSAAPVALNRWIPSQRVSNVESVTSSREIVVCNISLWLGWSCWYSFSVSTHMQAILDFTIHDDVIKWKHFPRYWSFVRGIHRSRLSNTPVTSHSRAPYGLFPGCSRAVLNKNRTSTHGARTGPVWRRTNFASPYGARRVLMHAL